jgi:peptidoglycan hydrolase-like protein with peptidoglycan-binding domain
MRYATILLLLGGCSMFSPSPASQPATVARPTAAQTEERAANVDSSATRDDIKATQGRLAREGFYHGTIDGVWGPATASALSAYQTRHNLTATGKLDDATRASFAPDHSDDQPPPRQN